MDQAMKLAVQLGGENSLEQADVYMSMAVAMVLVVLTVPGMIDITGRALDVKRFITPQNIALLIGASFVCRQ